MSRSRLPESHLTTLERVGDRFRHCLSVSAIHLPDQPLVYVNRQFEIDTGYARADCLGHNCRFLQGEMRDQPGPRVIAEAIDDGRAVFHDLVNFHRDGTPFINRLVLLPFNYISTPNSKFYLGVQRCMGRPEEQQISAFKPKNGELEDTINNPLSIALGFAELGDDDIEAIDGAISRIESYVDSL